MEIDKLWRNNLMNKKSGLVCCFLATAMMMSSFTMMTNSENPFFPGEKASYVSAAENKVVFIETKGCEESAYAKWAPVHGASGYNVYCDGNKIDSMLIRQYTGYFRADAVGIKAGNHTLKVVPVINGSENTSLAASADVSSVSYNREGFCFASDSVTGGKGLGAYNDDGTLKSGTVVLYVTEETKGTVKMSVQTSASAYTDCTGIGAILKAMQKGYEKRPVAIRIIGKVTASDVNTSGDTNNLLLKASSTNSPIQNITVEGIGEDATCYGFGIRCQRARSIEIRNLGVMLFGDDGIALETDNYNIWVHNNDIFYGTAGSDADQAKGDGSMDLKNDSKYITISYNHFWDSGKMSLCGMKSETGENFISYHHNWFDHSDSRHPRIRTMSVHVYNNYYDGNSKYGVGVTYGGCAFVESNYFRNCPNPMMSSGQGTDAKGEGTFSGENGGVIKAYGNNMTGHKSYITYAQDNSSFDAYEVSDPKTAVPQNVKALKGGTSYTNFDISKSMYSYKADNAKDVPAIVTAGAGRINGGDFTFKFTDADDTSYAVNQALMSAIRSYSSGVKAIGSGFKEDNSPVPVVTTVPVTTPSQPQVTTPVTTYLNPLVTTVPLTTVPSENQPGSVIAADTIFCSPDAADSGEGTYSNPTSVKNAVKNIKPGGVIWLKGGTYNFSSTLVISESDSGKSGEYKTISAAPGENVIFDFSSMSVDPSNRGVSMEASWWHWYGIRIQKAGDNGMILSGSNNIIEMCVFNNNQDTGLQISRTNTKYSDISQWPSNNLIKNCTAMNNCDDETMENADGFAAKLTCGEGNVFEGCMSYNNSDDGWDLYAKSATGPIGKVTFRNCIAFRNGYTEDGRGYGDCDGNGFKLGGSGVGTAHVLENCVSFENLHHGFTDNNNPLFGSLTNCTSYSNSIGGGKANFQMDRCTSGTFKNLLSYTGPGKCGSDKFNGNVTNTFFFNSSKYWQISSQTAVANSKAGTEISGPSDSDFVSVKAPEMKSDFHKIWRNPDGSINTQGFLKLAQSSKFSGTGADMTKFTNITQTTLPKYDTNVQTPVQTTTAAVTTAPPVTQVYKYGDINGSGVIDVTDLTMLSQYLLHDITLNDIQKEAADVVYDGEVDITDLALLRQYIMKDSVTLGKK